MDFEKYNRMCIPDILKKIPIELNEEQINFIVFTMLKMYSFSEETYNHSLHTLNIACVLAKKLELSKEDVGVLELAALVHDFGKLKIDKEILHSPKKLSPKEYETIKTHSQNTYDSNAQLGKYLLGKYEPSLSNAVKIANYFNCSLDYLTGNDDILNQYGIFHDLNVEIFLSRYLELIKENKTNENQLSINLNFSRNCCQRWRKNHIFPTLTILSNLSTYFNVPIEYLIGRIDERGE